LLLLEYKKRFGEISIAALQFFPKYSDLRVLTAEAQNRGADNIWVMNVTRYQRTQIV
jgi:hypothetical protein